MNFNGIDGEDGTEQEFMYTRNNTGVTPATPPRTQKNEASLFGDLGYWIDPNSGVKWTDDPQGVSDELMWEYVTTRVKEGTIWGPFSTPVIWAKWGKQGKIGQMSYLAGVWDSQTTYTKNVEKSPIVYYNGNYYYLKGEINSSQPTITSTNQNPVSRTDIWAQAENFEMVFTDILFVNDFAKLGSFIISYDWLISKNGTLYESNGTAHDIDDSHSWSTWDVNSAYTKFDPSSPDKNKSGSLNFVPAIAIDSLSGRCFFWKGKFTGDIHANSGYFKGEVHATSGDFTGTITAGGGSKIGGFSVDNNGNISATGNATFTGNIVANSLTLGNGVTIPESSVEGLTEKLNNIPELDGAGILYADDISISEQTTADGLTKRTITIGDHSFTEIEGGDFILTNVGLGTDSDNNNYAMISSEGVLKARNAIIYGTIYANAGNIGGFSIDSNGNISGNNATFSGIVNATGGTFSGDITIGGTLTIQKSGSSDGLKLDSSGNIKRYDGSDWVDLFAVRHTKYVSTSAYNCTNLDDLVLVGYNGATITLPASPSDGKCITVRNIGTDHWCKINGGTHNVNVGGSDTLHGTNWVNLNNDDRAEFIYYGGTWYWNAYGT